MVCTNCQSKKLILVQNKLFCTDCGHTLADSAAAAAKTLDKSGLPDGVTILSAEVAPTVEPVPEAVAETLSQEPDAPTIEAYKNASEPPLIVNHNAPTTNEKPKKRKVGRPKAARLDMPVMTAAVVASVTRVTPKAAEAPKIHASAASKSNHTSSSNSMSDIRTAKTPGTVSDVVESVPDRPNLRPQTKQQSIATGDILAESWQGRFRPHHSLMALIPAAVIALISGGVAAAYLGPKSGQLSAITKSAAIPVLGDLLIILMLYYVCRSLATAAITFGAARSEDHRKVPAYRWWGVAINSFGGKLRFDLLMLLAELVVAGLIVGLVLVGGAVWPIPEYLQIAAIFGAFVILLFALSGLLLTQGLGRVSVVLGTTLPREAFSVGWGFFRNHFELVGAKLLSLILELLLIVPLVAAVVAVGWSTSGGGHWWLILTLTIAVAIGGALIGAGTAIWWESAYRHLVRAERISEAVTLLTGRKADKAHRLPLILITMLITFLVVAATIWPWLPWPAIS